MPSQTDVERRDRALVAFVIVTGGPRSRGRFIPPGSHRYRASRRGSGRAHRQDEVQQDIRNLVLPRWRRSGASRRGLGRVPGRAETVGARDPLFPATEVGVGKTGLFAPTGLVRRTWSDASPIRRVFRQAFEHVGLHFNPHGFRNTLAALGRDKCQTLAEMQAWAQNLGHESLTTTFGSYGKVASHEQGKLVRNCRQAEGRRGSQPDRLIDTVGGMQG